VIRHENLQALGENAWLRNARPDERLRWPGCTRILLQGTSATPLFRDDRRSVERISSDLAAGRVRVPRPASMTEQEAAAACAERRAAVERDVIAAMSGAGFQLDSSAPGHWCCDQVTVRHRRVLRWAFSDRGKGTTQERIARGLAAMQWKNTKP